MSYRVKSKCEEEQTPPAPYTSTEFKGKIALVLEKIGSNPIEWDALDAVILGSRVL